MSASTQPFQTEIQSCLASDKGKFLKNLHTYFDCQSILICLNMSNYFAVHGGWEAWESWTSCSRTCNGGVTSRERSCDAPVPDFGGRFCEGGNPSLIDIDGVEWEWKTCNEHRCEFGESIHPCDYCVYIAFRKNWVGHENVLYVMRYSCDILM